MALDVCAVAYFSSVCYPYKLFSSLSFVMLSACSIFSQKMQLAWNFKCWAIREKFLNCSEFSDCHPFNQWQTMDLGVLWCLRPHLLHLPLLCLQKYNERYFTVPPWCLFKSHTVGELLKQLTLFRYNISEQKPILPVPLQTPMVRKLCF